MLRYPRPIQQQGGTGEPDHPLALPKALLHPCIDATEQGARGDATGVQAQFQAVFRRGHETVVCAERRNVVVGSDAGIEIVKEGLQQAVDLQGVVL